MQALTCRRISLVVGGGGVNGCCEGGGGGGDGAPEVVVVVVMVVVVVVWGGLAPVGRVDEPGGEPVLGVAGVRDAHVGQHILDRC